MKAMIPMILLISILILINSYIDMTPMCAGNYTVQRNASKG